MTDSQYDYHMEDDPLNVIVEGAAKMEERKKYSTQLLITGLLRRN